MTESGGIGSTGLSTLQHSSDQETEAVEHIVGDFQGTSVTSTITQKLLPSPPSASGGSKEAKLLVDYDIVEIPGVEPTVGLTSEGIKKIRENMGSRGLPTVDLSSKASSRETILAGWRKKDTWKAMDKQLLKKGNVTKKGFQKLLTQMKKMSFEKKTKQDMMAYYALDKYHSDQFSKEQMKEFMSVFFDRHVEARVTEKLNSLEKQLTPSVRKGEYAYQPNPVVVLAELAVNVAGEKKESTTEAALKDLNQYMHTELYNQDEFLQDLIEGARAKVQEIDQHVTSGLERGLKLALRAQMKGVRKNKRLASGAQLKLAEEVDLAVKKNIESQLREKRTRVESPLTKDQSMREDADAMLSRATQLKTGMLAQIKAGAGESYKPEIFEQMTVSSYFDSTADTWIQKNVVAREEKSSLGTEQPIFSDNKKDSPELELSFEPLETALTKDSLLPEIDAELARRAEMEKTPLTPEGEVSTENYTSGQVGVSSQSSVRENSTRIRTSRR